MCILSTNFSERTWIAWNFCGALGTRYLFIGIATTLFAIAGHFIGFVTIEYTITASWKATSPLVTYFILTMIIIEALFAGLTVVVGTWVLTCFGALWPQTN